jgi:hypothetical protein
LVPIEECGLPLEVAMPDVTVHGDALHSERELEGEAIRSEKPSRSSESDDADSRPLSFRHRRAPRSPKRN